MIYCADYHLSCLSMGEQEDELFRTEQDFSIDKCFSSSTTIYFPPQRKENTIFTFVVSPPCFLATCFFLP